jgi:hypothetical protein
VLSKAEEPPMSEQEKKPEKNEWSGTQSAAFRAAIWVNQKLFARLESDTSFSREEWNRHFAFLVEAVNRTETVASAAPDADAEWLENMAESSIDLWPSSRARLRAIAQRLLGQQSNYPEVLQRAPDVPQWFKDEIDRAVNPAPPAERKGESE